MVFSSILFVFYFLPVFLMAYYACPKGRNGILLAGSVLFYAWGEMAYVPLLGASIFANYLSACAIARRSTPRFWLVVGIAANLLFLGWFKYAAFADRNMVRLVGWHIPGAWRFRHIPLGISFFTFQGMSYVVDVYRGDAPCEKRLRNVATYIAMFPQLIAGPIVRFKDVSMQLHSREIKLEDVASGMRLFCLGLASKVLLANTLAVPADAAFSCPAARLGGSLAWLGVLCYSLQIYFDFAGYSIMAIGLGRMLGFTFPKNFDFPYTAQSVTEFWHRWHISLSTWFRDYLYVPLGGNRTGRFGTYRNLVIVFLLCGFWHGAEWTFVLWGLFHGFFLVVERSFRGRRLAIPRPMRHVYLLAVVASGWIVFRSASLTQAADFANVLFFGNASGLPAFGAVEFLSPDVLVAIAAGLLAAGLLGRPVRLYRLISGEATGNGLWGPRVWLVGRTVCAMGLFVLSTLALASGTHNPFIYFNF